MALRKLGKSVGILDVDLFGPSLPRLMNLVSARPESSENGLLIPPQNYGVQCMSMGMLVDEQKALIWRGPMVQKSLHQLMWQVQWSPIDVLVVDMPPGTGDVGMQICMNLDIKGALLVTTPQYPQTLYFLEL
jgi:ATP-binding protein involved in chromosome partitioning